MPSGRCRRQQRLPPNLLRQQQNFSPQEANLEMALYADLALQDSVKEQLFRCKLHMLERKCSTGVEKLKALIGEHLQNGIPVSDILEKTKSLLTLRKALLSHNGYSKYSRDILRLFPEEEDDLAPLCF
ncbi:hypothetical protein EPR50_G00035480 [Perca flavescens]|uniref:Uncharacterized protein n=1 Tax=Perca flavescens TaxID=8167 RepID=A0A484DI48_PERFV|nr:hypothetical protein EPR50_G00035480 [Perca flavescens]